MRLSYSGYKTYLQCPRRYYNEVNKIVPPEKPSTYFALYGKLIEMFFKKYTNDITKNNISLTNTSINNILRKMWDYILDNNFVIWDDPWVRESSEQIYEAAYNDVLKNIQTFNFWKYAKSEVSISIKLKKTFDILSCRLDFITNNPDGTVDILDGKGTNKIDKNVDIEQLYFYILMYLLHNKKLPDRAGFLYYRYQLIKFIDFDMQTIIDFKNKLAIVKKAAKEDKVFQPKVGISKQCKWCAYRHTCEALIAKRKEKSEKKQPVIPFEFDGDILSFSPRGLEI